MSKTIATICARGGSKGLPRKNILSLHGKPLIGYTIEQALATPEIDHVYVSTDCPEIANVCIKFGAEVPFLRPKQLATSSIAKHPSIVHVIDWIDTNHFEVGRVVDLDPTSPLRTIEDIQTCISMLDDETDAVITGCLADKNPYFNMVEIGTSGFAHLSKTCPSQVASRQAAPSVYSMNASIYCWHSHTLALGLWGGKTRIHVMPRDRSIDIDELLDFKIVEFLMHSKQGKL